MAWGGTFSHLTVSIFPHAARGMGFRKWRTVGRPKRGLLLTGLPLWRYNNAAKWGRSITDIFGHAIRCIRAAHPLPDRRRV